jgi:hypothetical protein
MKLNHRTLLPLAALGLTSITADAAIVVTPSHIVSTTFGVTGTLIAIDVPTVATLPAFGGPGWTDAADDGFKTRSDGTLATAGQGGIMEIANATGSTWEPDGSPLSPAYQTYNNGGLPDIYYIFNLAASGIDLPDGATINAIYATWRPRGVTGGDYRYNEGAGLVTVRVDHAVAPAADMVLSWTDNTSTVRNANFQRLFAGPIPVTGGDGFTLELDDSGYKNAMQIDAIVLDVTVPSSGTPPTIETYNPADGATNVPLTANPQATFSESLALTGTGSVTLRNLTLGSGSDIVIALPDPRVSVTGTVLAINPGSRLDTGTDYAVRISADAIKDAAGDAFAGILDDTTWNFTTTTDATPPAIQSTIPVDDATGVAPYADLTATFGEAVALTGTGTVTIRNVGLATDAIVINLPNAQVSVSGQTLTINPTAHLAGGTEYAVRISGDAIKDINANPFAGIADDTTWSFTTAPPPSGGIEVTADHIVGTPTYGVLGSLRAVDVPYQGTAFPVPGPLGPDWPENPDDGWRMLTGSNLEANHGTSPWEPDGTPLAEAQTLRLNSAPGSTYTFNLPDGTIINAIYATWLTRGTSGATWSYTEGAASGSLGRAMDSAPAADLVLRWTDSASTTHDGNFERLFVGPISVEGGDGFTLKAVRTGNTHQADAVILDISGKAIITSFQAAGKTGIINQVAKTITVQVPFGTDLATLAPTFTLSSGTCNQTSGAPPSPTFAAAKPVHYVVTDTTTDPDTANDYAVNVTVAPQQATLVIDLGAGTVIEGGKFGTWGATNLPLPTTLPAGSILRSITVNTALTATDNANFASDLSVLLDPTPGTPGGDFSVEITNGNVPFGGAGVLRLGWPTAANAAPPPSVALVDTKTDADWSAAGPIDLSTTGLFLGNAYGGPVIGGTWSGTITLTYDVVSGGSQYHNWSGGAPFTGDQNGDGVENGLAFLLGASGPNANALELLPTGDDDGSGGLVLTFSCLNAANRGTSTLSVEHSTDLGQSDPWAAAPVPDSTSVVNGVHFQVSVNAADPNQNDIVATIPSIPGAGSLFGRLAGSEN